jgi:outer membrane protein
LKPGKQITNMKHLITTFLVFSFLLPSHSNAKELPLWEAGIGLAYADLPYYRGSNEHKVYVLPFPYIDYRGEFLQINREHMRGLLYESDISELDISLNASVPVLSGEITARSGMPDLDPTFEIGPSLNFHILRAQEGKYVLTLLLPVRPVWTTQLVYTGMVFQPKLNLDINNLGEAGWNLGLGAGVIVADQQYNGYYYDVPAAYATLDRPAYVARGGYSGMQYIASISKKFDHFWLGGFAKWDTLNGSVLSDSPLVKTEQNFTAGIALAWIFSQSTTMVDDKQ